MMCFGDREDGILLRIAAYKERFQHLGRADWELGIHHGDAVKTSEAERCGTLFMRGCERYKKRRAEP